jgi:DNA (cytosine-5)-methyltransferase 1
VKHLDLFSGIGGFSLAAQWVGGIETTQFVEINPFCQKNLAKNFPGVPIHADITGFTANAGDYDIITAGFPCQPHSTTGKRKASADDRDLWPETYRVICEVRPKWVVLENVRGILSSESGRFFGGILWDLAAAGFDAEWGIVSCADLGGSHKRERVWIVAYPNGQRRKKPHSAPIAIPQRQFAGMASEVERANTDAESAGLSLWSGFTNEQEIGLLSGLKRLGGGGNRQFTTEPTIHRGDDGIPDRVDRVKALGNSIVPQVAMIPLKRVLDLAGSES